MTQTNGHQQASMDVWAIALEAAYVEEKALRLTQTLADGGFIEGRSAKRAEDVDPEAIERALQTLEAQVAKVRSTWEQQRPCVSDR